MMPIILTMTSLPLAIKNTGLSNNVTFLKASNKGVHNNLITTRTQKLNIF